MRKLICLMSILPLLLGSQGCQRRTEAGCHEVINTVFDGFVFAGIGSNPRLDIAMGGNVGRPQSFSSGTTYTFVLPRSAEAIGGWATIRDRLRSAGAEIVVGPTVAGDLMHLTTGGPMFEFRFKCSGGTGFVRNELAPEIMRDEMLSRSWLLEKYLVRVDPRS